MLTRRLLAATFGLALFTGTILLAPATAESIVIHDARGRDVTQAAAWKPAALSVDCRK